MDASPSLAEVTKLLKDAYRKSSSMAFQWIWSRRRKRVRITLSNVNASQLHNDSGHLEIGTLAMGHSVICLFVRSHDSPVRSLVHSFAPELVGQCNMFVRFSRCPKSLCAEQMRLLLCSAIASTGRLRWNHENIRTGSNGLKLHS